MNEPVDPDKSLLIRVSGIGKDRLGIILKIATVIKENGGNIFLQRSINVAGEFAFVIVASFDKANALGVERVLRAFGDNFIGDDYVMFAQKILLSNFAQKITDGIKYELIVSGLDRAGIVELVARFLLERNLNLYSTQIALIHEPFSGTEKFSGTFEFTVPHDYDMDHFQNEIWELEQTHELTIMINQLVALP